MNLKKWRDSLAPGIGSRNHNLPTELKEAIVRAESVSYEFYERYKSIYSSVRLRVAFDCDQCGARHTSDFKHLNKRQRVRRPVCPKCVMKVATSDTEWRAANATAQRLIQSTPEQKQKNAAGVSRFWKENPERLQQMRVSVMAANQREDVRAKYREREQWNGRGVSGDYLSKWGWLSFSSSYELAFLLHLETRTDIMNVQRGPTIQYLLEGTQREFFVDYQATFVSGELWWCEVKSGYIGNHRDKKDKLREKLRAALDLVRQGHADRVVLVTEKTAPELFGFRMPRSNRHMMFRENAAKIIFASPKDEQRYG